ncbi:hypothetical protein Tco_0003039 [Tanacetum coccineum]
MQFEALRKELALQTENLLYKQEFAKASIIISLEGLQVVNALYDVITKLPVPEADRYDMLELNLERNPYTGGCQFWAGDVFLANAKKQTIVASSIIRGNSSLGFRTSLGET